MDSHKLNADKNPPLSEREQKLLQQCRSNPIVAERFEIIMDKFDSEVAGGMDAHQAEMLAIEQLGELGRSLMGQWASKTSEEVVKNAKDNNSSLIHNGKKNSNGTPHLEK